MRRLGSDLANSVIDKVKLEESKLRAYVGDLRKEDFRIYKSLTNGLRKESSLSLAINFFTMVRRLVNLYMAMFLGQYAWLQITVFMAISLLSTLYLGYTWPYKKRVQNHLSMFNETAILIIAYLIMVLVGISEEAGKKQAAG